MGKLIIADQEEILLANQTKAKFRGHKHDVLECRRVTYFHIQVFIPEERALAVSYVLCNCI